MKSAESVLACCVVGLACFIAGQAVAMRSGRVHSEAAGAIADRAMPAGLPGAALGQRSHGQDVFGDDGAALDAAHSEEIIVPPALLASAAPRPLLSPSEMRHRVQTGIEGTYLDELLLARDSAMARWPDHIGRPLRVFVREAERLEAWNPDYLPAVRDAFDTWTQAGIPVRFTFTADSALADVHVRFLDRFPNGISGKTVWSRDAGYWLVASDIQLAILHPSGGAVTPPQMRAIALHEVGHLLGLDHTGDTGNIMAARVRVRELSEADKATARLLYSVPAGTLR